MPNGRDGEIGTGRSPTAQCADTSFIVWKQKLGALVANDP